MAKGLLDASVFIAFEVNRPVAAERLPEETVISPVTLGELQAGVLGAEDPETRFVRLRTLQTVSDAELAPIDEDVVGAWAMFRAKLAEAERRVSVNDLWIAATALANGIPVHTQDDDFDPLVGISDLAVIKV